MVPPRNPPQATVGAVERGNAVVLVTLDPAGALLDRRRVALTEGLSTHPYHHEGAWAVGRYLNAPWARPMQLDDAIALVRQVQAAAEHGADEAVAALAGSVAVPIGAIAIRAWPSLPPTIEARIRDARAQTMADSVMYRQALAGAAEARGWAVHAYEPDHVLRDTVDAVTAIGKAAGPPWRAEQKLAAAAALAIRRDHLARDRKTGDVGRAASEEP
ncbi:MAG: hypothetical protein ABMB14_01935 [Myxococcota bacterium]